MKGRVSGQTDGARVVTREFAHLYQQRADAFDVAAEDDLVLRVDVGDADLVDWRCLLGRVGS